MNPNLIEMGEREVVKKNNPLGLDLENIVWHVRKPKDQRIKVRLILPMSITCGTCGSNICKGTQFNSLKEDVVGETFIGIQILRFYFKCTKCRAEITFKTDPRNSDFILESGATRNSEQVDEAAIVKSVPSAGSSTRIKVCDDSSSPTNSH
ncbi:hypothetical protein ABFX02_11G088400 [Erythranthe guttata]